jgi:hypothetical protein
MIECDPKDRAAAEQAYRKKFTGFNPAGFEGFLKGWLARGEQEPSAIMVIAPDGVEVVVKKLSNTDWWVGQAKCEVIPLYK